MTDPLKPGSVGATTPLPVSLSATSSNNSANVGLPGGQSNLFNQNSTGIPIVKNISATINPTPQSASLQSQPSVSSEHNHSLPTKKSFPINQNVGGLPQAGLMKSSHHHTTPSNVAPVSSQGYNPTPIHPNNIIASNAYKPAPAAPYIGQHTGVGRPVMPPASSLAATPHQQPSASVPVTRQPTLPSIHHVTSGAPALLPVQTSRTAPTMPPVYQSAPAAPVTASQRPAPSSVPAVSNKQEANTAAPNARPLNVKDALTYLDQVKYQFAGQPEVYNRFLDIMKDFKSQEIDTPGVIERVSTLFRSQPRLIIGFNTFLPPGYILEPTNNPADPVRVTTPANVHYKPFAAPPVAVPAPRKQPVYEPPVTAAQDPAPSSSRPTRQVAQAAPALPQTESAGRYQIGRGPVEFNHAINYVNKIKTRFANQPDTYRYFLEILQTYQRDDKPIKEVYSQVQYLFAGAPDLLEEFKQFLPDTSGSAAQTVPTTSKKSSKRQVPPPSHYYSQPPTQAPPKKKVRVGRNDKPSSAEELDFFDKCKRVIGNKTTYNEFLKILNLFTQETIEAKVLIERVEPFLGKSPELFEWFKRFVKYDDDDVIYNIPVDKVAFDVRSCRQSGHSYRKLPPHVPRPMCSGRDELAKEVLNDDWVGLPVFLSENGFLAHKKTPHEEAMFKCEEERYEFDLNIEANLSVINILEPIAKKIQLMPVEERANFKLLPGLGGFSTTIYKRIIKKVYDNEKGAEIIEALHQNPDVAVPIVLKRLKQKDEEWKRSQREWNKVWREIDMKNFSKALDHQAVNFKNTDRKSVVQKYLISEIEVLYNEQKEKKSHLANRYQFDFSFKNRDMFKQVNQILFNYVETSATISASEEEKIRVLLSDFVPKMFLIDPKQLEDSMEAVNSIDAMGKDSGVPMEIDVPTEVTPKDDSAMDIDGAETVEKPLIKKRTSHTLYANNALYTFFRLFQMLYSRLVRMKEVSDELQGTRPRSEVKNHTAMELGLRKDSSITMTEEDRFSELVKDICLFANNDMDSSDFEDKTRELFWTSGYIIFTVDKLIQAIVKQLQLIALDSKCAELLTIYSRDREKNTTGPRQEALYRLCAEQIIQDENIYRIEYFFSENVMTIQVLGKEDQLSDDAISSEEKWSLYVDQFVQLSTTENGSSKRRDPFLKRNLPTHVGEDPPLNVETKSGLELKICVNTYKIFFVDNTEDYFRRKRPVNSGSALGLCQTEKIKTVESRSNKFHRSLLMQKWSENLTSSECSHSLVTLKKMGFTN